MEAVLLTVDVMRSSPVGLIIGRVGAHLLFGDEAFMGWAAHALPESGPHRNGLGLKFGPG